MGHSGTQGKVIRMLLHCPHCWSTDSQSLGVKFWQENVYLEDNDDQPSRYIQLADILHHVVCCSIPMHRDTFWVTIPTSGTLVWIFFKKHYASGLAHDILEAWMKQTVYQDQCIIATYYNHLTYSRLLASSSISHPISFSSRFSSGMWNKRTGMSATLSFRMISCAWFWNQDLLTHTLCVNLGGHALVSMSVLLTIWEWTCIPSSSMLSFCNAE